jgi:hypothetical protein
LTPGKFNIILQPDLLIKKEDKMVLKNTFFSFFTFYICLLLLMPIQAIGSQKNSMSREVQMNNLQHRQLSAEEKKWFTRFQEGTMLVQGWQQITEDILAKTPREYQEDQRKSLELLGYRIGYEWSRNNKVRKIDNKMLRQWGRLLKKTARKDPRLIKEVIDDIDQTVASLLN